LAREGFLYSVSAKGYFVADVNFKKIEKSIKKSIEEKLKELKNFNKKKLKVQKIFYRLNCIRDDYNNKIVDEITRTKLKYITIEDLKVSNMMKNKHLS